VTGGYSKTSLSSSLNFWAKPIPVSAGAAKEKAGCRKREIKLISLRISVGVWRISGHTSDNILFQVFLSATMSEKTPKGGKPMPTSFCLLYCLKTHQWDAPLPSLQTHKQTHTHTLPMNFAAPSLYSSRTSWISALHPDTETH